MKINGIKNYLYQKPIQFVATTTGIVVSAAVTAFGAMERAGKVSGVSLGKYSFALLLVGPAIGISSFFLGIFMGSKHQKPKNSETKKETPKKQETEKEKTDKPHTHSEKKPDSLDEEKSDPQNQKKIDSLFGFPKINTNQDEDTENQATDSTDREKSDPQNLSKIDTLFAPRINNESKEEEKTDNHDEETERKRKAFEAAFFKKNTNPQKTERDSLTENSSNNDQEKKRLEKENDFLKQENQQLNTRLTDAVGGSTPVKDLGSAKDNTIQEDTNHSNVLSEDASDEEIEEGCDL